MSGFLVLLPLALVSFAIGFFVASSPQIADYVAYVTDLSRPANYQSISLQVAAHVVAYAIMCFILVATVRTVSRPLPPERPAALRLVQLLLEIIFVAVPSGALIWLATVTLRGDPGNRLIWAVTAVLAIGLVISVYVCAARRHLELFRSTLRPFSITWTDVAALICVVAAGAVIASFVIDPVASAHFIGMFPVLWLASAAAFLAIAAIFSRGSSPVAVVSTVFSTVLLLHLFDQVVLPPREFRHTKIDLPKGPSTAALVAGAKGPTFDVGEVMKTRRIPSLDQAFRAWLAHRRPAIEAYRSRNKAYPVFIVSAQGGGIYAAYHPALSLARLYDACPEFAHHLFGISSVSGGSLGAAVFAELLRSLPQGAPNDPAQASQGCTITGATTLEDKVTRFFDADFLSPVIASAFIFDIPSLLLPQLRFGLDRAKALEYSLEAGWKRIGFSGKENYGLASPFYERWQPTELAPALFMATTGVNYGIPVLISQVDWSNDPRISTLTRVARRRIDKGEGPTSKEVRDFLRRLELQDQQSRVSAVANILGFRPDLQLATSTAVVLSARFPYVTPPGNIRENEQINRSLDLYKNTKVLELTDGGYFDNSGGSVAIDILHRLESFLERDDFKEFKDVIKFHLIRFTDKPAKRHGTASERAHFELITPLVAFDAVRLARGAQLRGVGNSKRSAAHYIYLSDEWFDASLNWLLAEKTKRGIEARASWERGYQNEVCCDVQIPRTPIRRKAPLTETEEQELKKITDVQRFVPNGPQFRALLELVREGDVLPPAASRPDPVPAPAAQPVAGPAPPAPPSPPSPLNTGTIPTPKQ
ncbi:MAG: hypothetical protein F9K29_06365 [Hyphomicrobiaceae bacterium]|nr:MAG: hypothetical protein F9K29_06365 [Hyphomicrobiaceae bacterium]